MVDAGRAGRGHVRRDVPHARAPRRRSARLADLEPRTLAIMHGSSYNGDCAKALLALADDYDRRLTEASAGHAG